MQKLTFDVEINAPAQKVWDVLWNDATYPEWTRPFGGGGYAKTDWQKGSRVHFLSATGEGMYSTIEKTAPGEVMIFKHLGYVKNGVEQPESEESKKWAGAMEEYYLEEKEGKTILTCNVDIEESHVEYFKKAFPEAFLAVKDIAER